MLRVDHLTKRYGDTVAVDDLSFDVAPGVVTGFLGPNGSGKSTTMRVMLGLDRPTKGQTSINGHAYHDFPAPLREVGAQLDAKSVHPGRSARNHLRALATSNAIPLSRVDEVLEFAGIASVADKKVGGFSLGMSQRLGIAAAILGDPGVLLFDEPINGLDPEGIRWIREFFANLAREGRTVFVSSHLMSEMALTADQIIVIGRGHFIAQGSVDDLTRNTAGTVFVASADNARLAQSLRDLGASVAVSERGLEIAQMPSNRIGEIALANGIALSELTPQRASLEEVFMELTADSIEYGSHKAPS
ncbi:MAG TPA: ATP-binding cassette domain-containing protein [Acidimicrobiales bacterium]|nr:ATP-binding cassette domain-containing protein [Acidimicrobiales bacterium]